MDEPPLIKDADPLRTPLRLASDSTLTQHRRQIKSWSTLFLFFP